MTSSMATRATRATEVWTIDPAHTTVEFAVRHLMIATVKGRFGEVAGTVEMEGDDPTTARIQVEIGAASIDTREPKRDAHLRSADFLEVDRYPVITFRSTRVERGADGALRVVGDLTIRDVTREVVLAVREEGRATAPWGANVAAFSATGKINRKDWGLTWNQALESGGVLVGDELKLSIEVELVGPEQG